MLGTLIFSFPPTKARIQQHSNKWSIDFYHNWRFSVVNLLFMMRKMLKGAHPHEHIHQKNRLRNDI